MSEASFELQTFMSVYERATNTHDIGQVVPLIWPDAVYWFSDGSHRGIAEITAAIEATFAAIQDETYAIHDVEWVAVGAELAVCRYRFAWTGYVEGAARSGQGRGTNVVTRRRGEWRMLHEHLSS